MLRLGKASLSAWPIGKPQACGKAARTQSSRVLSSGRELIPQTLDEESVRRDVSTASAAAWGRQPFCSVQLGTRDVVDQGPQRSQRQPHPNPRQEPVDPAHAKLAN